MISASVTPGLGISSQASQKSDAAAIRATPAICELSRVAVLVSSFGFVKITLFCIGLSPFLITIFWIGLAKIQLNLWPQYTQKGVVMASPLTGYKGSPGG